MDYDSCACFASLFVTFPAEVELHHAMASVSALIKYLDVRDGVCGLEKAFILCQYGLVCAILWKPVLSVLFVLY